MIFVSIIVIIEIPGGKFKDFDEVGNIKSGNIKHLFVPFFVISFLTCYQ